MLEVLLGVVMFTLVVLALVVVILAAKARLVASGEVSITVNDQKTLRGPAGGKLLGALSDAGVLVSSACGGGGTCAQCEVKVHSGGGDILPTERTHISRREAREGCRLSCQVAVKQDMRVEVPPEAFETKKWLCKVRRTTTWLRLSRSLCWSCPRASRSTSRAAATSKSNARRTRWLIKILNRRRVPPRLGQVRRLALCFEG